jgi:hypothetical protein
MKRCLPLIFKERIGVRLSANGGRHTMRMKSQLKEGRDEFPPLSVVRYFVWTTSPQDV